MEGAYHFMRKRKYSAELIISIVKERIEKETSWECLSAKYNIHHMEKHEMYFAA